MIRTQVLLTDEIIKEVKKLSVAGDISLSKVIRQLLIQSLKQSGSLIDGPKNILEQPRGNMAMDRIVFDESDIPLLIRMWNKNMRVVSWEPFRFGYSNKIYKINIKNQKPVVLKVAVVPQRYDKLGAEIKLISDLHKDTLPLPQILYMQKNRQRYKYPFVIYNYIKGDNLMEVISGLSEMDLQRISLGLGEIVAKLHRHTYRRVIDFGKERTYENWLDFVTEIMDNGLFKMKDNNLRPDLVGKIENLYTTIKSSIVEPVRYSLIHRDIQAMNLLVNNNKIVGLLDFESSMTGDNLYEFAFLEGLLFDRYPSAKKPFYEGYRRYGELPGNHREIIDFYTVMTKVYYIQRAIDYKEPDRFRENFDFLDRFFKNQ